MNRGRVGRRKKGLQESERKIGGGAARGRVIWLERLNSTFRSFSLHLVAIYSGQQVNAYVSGVHTGLIGQGRLRCDSWSDYARRGDEEQFFFFRGHELCLVAVITARLELQASTRYSNARSALNAK